MILGETINLRLMRERDLERFVELSNDLECRGEHFPTDLWSETEVKKRFQENGYWSGETGVLLIVAKEDDRILGSVYCMKTMSHFDAVELGYILYDKASRGKGLMTEAIGLASGYLFESRKIWRVQLTIEPENLASIRVAEKCGFLREGLLRSAVFFRGRPRDVCIFGLTRSDWESNRSKMRQVGRSKNQFRKGARKTSKGSATVI